MAIAELGQGNIDAALAVVHAVELFRPSAILFVGIAGALHSDLQIGDVVTAVRVYAYQSGTMDDRGFRARPRAHDADLKLEQLARVIARSYRERPDLPPVYFRPVAAGDVVLNSLKQPLSEQLNDHYDDAGAIEMESAGMARACHTCRVPALVIRGISDRADGDKEIVDAAGSQPLAAQNAADFAVAVIVDYLSGSRRHATESKVWPPSPDLRRAAGSTPPVDRTTASSVDKASAGTARKPLSVEYQNAVRSAESYLRNGVFSRKGLIEQLSSEAGEGFSLEAATFAVDSLEIDYNKQAVKSARSYLRSGAFSRKGLIEQLSSDAGEGFTRSQAAYGADAVGL
ncbi:nucleoside phosphorylase [Actinoplanes italicus]|uniref:Nucleoside phosphorylase n=1 Tax=Actinoplanes italicus TaxID=113567 RepID=A0A2T0JUY5_9ACTN|nr:nucleoside phosphorylase [Actinoplanes italicus]